MAFVVKIYLPPKKINHKAHEEGTKNTKEKYFKFFVAFVLFFLVTFVVKIPSCFMPEAYAQIENLKNIRNYQNTYWQVTDSLLLCNY